MQEHATYWKGLIDDGIAIVFGLVLHPRGSWGVNIIEVGNELDICTLGTKRSGCQRSRSYF
jgi:hypothetical protein